MANTIVIDILADTRSLVKGVNDTNTKLNTLNGTTSGLAKGFGLVTKAIAFIGGLRFAWNMVQDFEKEQIAFGKLATLFGKDADAITEKVNLLSEKFFIDDGDIAQTLVTLGNSTLIRYRGILDEIAELTLLANNLDPTKSIDTLTTAYVKALRSGKLLGGDEISKFGLGSTLTQAELESFQKLKTVTEQIKFLYAAAQDDINTRLTFSTTQQLQKEFEDLKDVISELLLPILKLVVPLLKTLTDLITYKDEDGQTKLHEEVKLLAAALGLIWTVGKLAALVTALTGANTFLGKIGKNIGIVRGAFAGLSFATATTAFSLLGTAIATAWTALSPFKKIAIVLGAGLILLEVLPEKYEKAAKEILQGIIDGLTNPTSLIPVIPDIFKNFWKNVKEGFISWARFYFKISSPSKVAEEVGNDIVAGLFKAFSITTIITRIKTFFTDIRDRFTIEVANINWSLIGQSIIKGLVSGMQAIASSPINFITKLARDMVTTFKTFFKISSPSRVMAGYGANLMQGLALGIQGNASLASASMSGLNLRPSFAGARGSANYITINAGIGADPYEVGRYVKSALDKYAGVNGR